MPKSSPRRSRDAFYHGWGGWAWGVEDARWRNGTESYKEGSLVIDIFDAWTKTLVWHGFTRDAVFVDSSASARTIKSAVAGMIVGEQDFRTVHAELTFDDAPSILHRASLR